MPNLTEAMINEVQRDLSAFSDPGSIVEVSSTGVLKWNRDRVEQNAQLQISQSQFPDVNYGGKKYTYVGFLASEALADLQHLAWAIQTQIPPLNNFTSGPAKALADEQVSDGVDLILERSVQFQSLPFGSTRVLFLHGNAGAGKTSLLRHVTRIQAERYLCGETTTLLLYLDAQGKGLSQLEDVMARALQDLRARFTYHCLAPLARRYCVVPIVDGFDELIGPTSAREAFGNLAQFLSQLDRQGVLITSSRSAFIDYQTLYERATEIAAAQGLSYEIYPIELLLWPDEIIFRLVKSQLGDIPSGESKIRSLLESQAGELVRKPFFLSHICNIIAEGGEVQGDRDLVRQVVDAALEREKGKLQNKRQKSLLTAEQHRKFCQIIADEMWWEERAELDLPTIRTIAEMYAEDSHLSPEDTKLLIDRSIAHGLLKNTQGDSNKREFEHELFRFEFQAGQIAKAMLGESGELKDYLLRREIPQDLFERIIAYRQFSPNQIMKIVETVNDIVRLSKNNPFSAINGGTLVATIIRSRIDLPDKGNIESLHFRNLALSDLALNEWKIRDCIFEKTDLSKITWSNCEIDTSLFITCRIGMNTILKGCRVNPQIFAGIETSDNNEVYDPEIIIEVLKNTKAILSPEEEIAKPRKIEPSIEQRLSIVERLLKHARSHFYLSAQDDQVFKSIISESEWPNVEKIFRKYGLLADVKLQRSGPSRIFFRLNLPPDVIWRGRATQDLAAPEIILFWKELSQK